MRPRRVPLAGPLATLNVSSVPRRRKQRRKNRSTRPHPQPKSRILESRVMPRSQRALRVRITW